MKNYKITLTEFWKSKKTLAIHCDTEEKANRLLQAFGKLGKKWHSGESYTKASYYNDHLCSTCYSNHRKYSDCDYYKKSGYTIFEFGDVDLDK